MDTVRVVVADDNIQLRDMVAEYLQEQNGIEVVGTAGDGVETLRLGTGCAGLRPDYAADGRLCGA